VFSSRKLERGTYDSVAFRFIAANSHPDHDTIATFRRRFLPQLNKLFAQILLIAHQMEVLKLGNVSLDGSKIKTNADILAYHVRIQTNCIHTVSFCPKMIAPIWLLFQVAKLLKQLHRRLTFQPPHLV
jgi:hypothetical protein